MPFHSITFFYHNLCQIFVYVLPRENVCTYNSFLPQKQHTKYICFLFSTENTLSSVACLSVACVSVACVSIACLSVTYLSVTDKRKLSLYINYFMSLF